MPFAEAPSLFERLDAGDPGILQSVLAFGQRVMELRVALLGCGGIGARHAAAVKLLEGEMRLVACCGRDLGADRDVRGAASAPRAFTDFDAHAGRGPARTC